MLQSRVSSFSDPYAYQAAALTGDMTVSLAAKGDFRSRLIVVEMDRLRVQRFDETLPRVASVAIHPGRTPINFLADADQASTLHNGHELSTDAIAFYGQGVHDHLRNAGPMRIAGISMLPEELAAAAEAVVGRPIAPPQVTTIFRPDSQALVELRRVHAAVSGLAVSEAAVLATPAIAKALEQELIRAYVLCLAGAGPSDVRSSSSHAARAMARFEEFLEGRQDEAVYVGEICAAIGVSESLLRAICRERLGMGPLRYLWLRRMNLARHALLRADPSRSSVTDIATGFGFWELGRFSVQYRALFGEQPSATLHRPP